MFNRLYSTIKANERIMKTTLNGVVKFIDGPRVVFHPFSKIEKLKSFVASPHQYLKITKVNGEIEFIKGPTMLFENPIEHMNVENKDIIHIKMNSSLCVHTKNKDKIDTKIISGPSTYIPNVEDVEMKIYREETIQENKYAKIVYIDGRVEHLQGPLKILHDERYIKNIEILSPIYVKSNEVIITHTLEKDNNTLTRNIIKGKQYYVPKSNETIHNFSWSGTPQDATHNVKVPNQLQFTTLRNMPQQMYYDILDVRTADHVLIKIKLLLFFEITNIEKMLDNTNDPICNIATETSTNILRLISNITFEDFKLNIKNLNDINLYSTLKNLEQIGVSVNKVSLIGYDAPEILQQIHNNALEEKTEIELKTEIVKSEQENKKYELECEIERNKLNINLQMEKTKAEIEELKEKQKYELERLEKLKNIGVDISNYLNKADKTIQINSSKDAKLLINPDA
jgi:hypothetical protein